MSRSRSSSFSSASDDQTLSSRSTTSEESSGSRSETPSDSEKEAPSDEETKSAASSRMSDPERGRRYRQSSEFGNSERKTPPTGRGFLECSGWDQPGTSCHKHQRFCKCRGIGCTKRETKDVDKQSNPYKIQGCSYYGTEERNERKGEEMKEEGREERNEGGREERRIEKREKRRVADDEEKARAKAFMDVARNLYGIFQRVVKP